MKGKRYSSEQIIGIYNAHKAGAKIAYLMANMAFLSRVSTAVSRSTTAWKYPNESSRIN